MRFSSTSFFERISLGWIIALGAIVRFVPALLLAKVSDYDIDSYWLVSKQVLAVHDVYTNPALVNRHPYLPMLMYWLGFARWISNHLGLDFPFIVKCAFIGADVLIIVLIFYALKRNGKLNPELGALLYAINPIAIFITAYHGQFDAIPIVFLLLSLIFINRSAGLSGISMGFGILIKSWPVLGFPTILYSLREVKQKIIFVVSAFVIPLSGIFLYVIIYKANWLIVLKNAVSYNHGIGIWGYTYLLRLLALWIPSLKYFISHYFYISRFITLGILAIVWYRTIRRQNPFGVVLTTLIAFLAFTHAFSIQYLIWIIPFGLIEADNKWFWYYNLAAFSYCFLVYNTLILRTAITNILALPFADLAIIIPSGLPCWFVLLGWAFYRIKKTEIGTK